MKSVTILLLHIQHGGIEKQTISLANELCKYYKINIISTYSMLSEPAYPVDPSINVKYLIDDKPNRDEFKAAVKNKNIVKIFKEGFKALKIIFLKKRLMIKEVKNLDCDYCLSTRIEFAEMLSKYAPGNVIKITQEHLHDDSPEYIQRIKESFYGLDYLLVLCEGSEINHSVWLPDKDRTKIVKIPNILEHIPEKTAALSGKNIISVGRLHPVKNFKALVEVFHKVKERHPDATLTIVGGGDQMEELNKTVEDFGLCDSVTITGMVSKQDVENYMLASDVYCMTSLTECFPMVLLEASSVGLPLVSFDVPVGPKAIIEDGTNGYLIEDKDIDAMAEKVSYLLDEREELKRLGKNAKVMARSYLPENIIPLWRELFK